MQRLTITLPVELFDKVDIAAKALWITRSDYIRQALARAVKQDEDFINHNAPKFAQPGTKPAEEDDEDTKLLRRYGMIN